MKPGWKTSEFLTSIAVIAGALVSSGFFKEEQAIYKVLSLVVAVLAALGYTWSRTVAKKGGGQ